MEIGFIVIGLIAVSTAAVLAFAVYKLSGE